MLYLFRLLRKPTKKKEKAKTKTQTINNSKMMKINPKRISLSLNSPSL